LDSLTGVKARPGAWGDIDSVKSVLELTMMESKLGAVAEAPLSLPLNISASKRLAREWRTMAAMVGCYCSAHHAPKAGLCPGCRGLLDYATVRLDRCRYGREKPTCANCPVHCYQRDRRDQMKAVMRYAGPRMLWQHPVLSLWHWLDGFRRAPALPG
jgi:hypothetical protein